MYNLNMSGIGGNNLLSVPQGEASSTPRTPEILNNLLAMSNPFDSYRGGNAPRLASSPPGGSDTTSSSSGSPSCVSPPSVQHTCSQLIKEGLKLTIQTKRRQTERSSTSTSTNDEDGTKVARRDEVSRDSLGDDDDDDLFSTGDGLTPEDEERRRRRRERNKIAATKCRLKKRERTVNLVQESEILENQNHDLKSQIQELENQRRRLVDMLSVHRPSCTKQQHFNNIETSQSFQNQNFHRIDNTYPRATSAISMESTSSSMYRRVNISSYSPRPSSTSAIESSMAYRRMEMTESYERPTSAVSIEPTYQRLETTVEENSSFCRPAETAGLLQDASIATYHTYDEEVIKDPTIMLVPYCKLENSSFLRMSNDQYTCQPNLTNLDHSLDYVKLETSPVTYQRPASTFGRPISVDINTPVSPNYDSHPEGLNSPSIAPNTYQHFEDNAESTFTAGFAATGIDRGCIA